jgi:nicotinate-nucleotide adenylyltransferase
MNVAMYGGSFDPVHVGHLAVAKAAMARFDLGRVYFVPADVQPLKRNQQATAYYHRFAMLALALQSEKNLVPSLLEAPEVIQRTGELVSYSIDTVRRFRAGLKKSDRLFFLVGIDAFLSIAKWRSPVELLRECEFIVASRPGYSLGDVAEALPEEMRPPEKMTRMFKANPADGDLVYGGAVIHLLSDVNVPLSATEIRAAIAKGRPITKFVGSAVADYIKKTKLYRAEADAGSPPLPRPKLEPPAQKPKLQLVHGKSRGSR